jgi:uncharacterized peroxidase-related enzyme
VKSHAAVAALLLGDEALVEAVLKDVESSPLAERDKVLYRLVERVNADSHTLTAADLAEVRAAGWSDEAIYDAITVCALFNFYNRWIDASGVHALPDEAHRMGAERLGAGYLCE